MESIKWKMVSLAQTTEEAEARAAHFSKELARVNAIADDFEEQVRIAESLCSVGKNWLLGVFLAFHGFLVVFSKYVFWKPGEDYEKITKNPSTARNLSIIYRSQKYMNLSKWDLS